MLECKQKQLIFKKIIGMDNKSNNCQETYKNFNKEKIIAK